MSFRVRLRQRASSAGARIVLPEAEDPRVREAAATLDRDGIAVPLLLDAGAARNHPRRADVADLLRERRPDRVRDGVHALDLAADPVRLAAGLVALGEVEACVAGAVRTTAEVARAALWAIGTTGAGRGRGGLLSSAFYMALPDGAVFTFTDAGVVPDPDAEQLAAIALAAVHDRPLLVGDMPRVAFLSFATGDSADSPSVRKVTEAVKRFRELAPDVPADGPLQGDAALSPEVAERKRPGSAVGGRANVLVFPDLDAGNIAYKLVQRLARASAAGPLFQGLRRPMSDLSRGADPDDIVDVAAMVALQSLQAGEPNGAYDHEPG